MVDTFINISMGRAGSSGGKNYLVGFKELMTNLNIEIGKIEGRGMKGLIQAAREIKKETLTGGKVTPKEYGNLRASWFIVTKDGIVEGKNPTFKENPRWSTTYLTINHVDVMSECQGELSGKSTKSSPVLTIGYSVPYSGYIHEMIGVKNWTQEGTKSKYRKNRGPGDKWLQEAISNKQGTILKIIGDNVRIKT